MSIEDSIVLIKSRGDRKDIGTGFVIYQDKTASYVLTCAHVVKAIGKESINVDRQNAELIAYGLDEREEGVDLAVLKVEGLNKPALDLWTFSKRGDSFKTYGYYNFDNQGTHRRDSIEGKLEKQSFRRINGEDIKDWDLLVTGSDLLKPGCSGAPVLNDQNEAIGVVTHKLLDGQKGAAISIEALEKLENWELDIRPYLYIPHSVRNVDYTQLQDLLAENNWEAADEATHRLMIKAAKREESGYLETEDIENFPCEDLRIINDLWIKYSQGRWGISIQNQIWQECGSPKDFNNDGDWIKFGNKVGWRLNEFGMMQGRLALRATITEHLPTFAVLRGWGCFQFSALFSRSQTCNL
jgi:GUN4-like/Trypsin-like peptidase domain